MKKILLTFFTSILLIAFAEIFFRYYYLPPGTVNIYDTVLGWKHRPDSSGCNLVNNKKIYFEYDEEGFRITGGKIDNPSGKNILITGDSFIDGLEVESRNHIQRYLRDELYKKGWNVYTYGVNGYGTDQEILYIKESYKKYKWKTVGIAFFIGNDFGNNIQKEYKIITKTYYKPYAEIYNKKLIYRNIPVPAEKNNICFKILKEHSSIYRYIKEQVVPKMQTLYAYITSGNTPNLSIMVSTKPDNDRLKKSIDITKALMEDIDIWLMKRQSELFVIIIPEYNMYKSDSYTWILKTTEDICKELKIDYINLYTEFEDNPDKYYIINNGHFSAEGHKKASETISRFLLKKY